MEIDLSWLSFILAVVAFAVGRLSIYVKNKQKDTASQVGVEKQLENLQKLISDAQEKYKDIDLKINHISQYIDTKTDGVKIELEKDIRDIKTDMKELLQLIIEIIRKK